MEVLLYSATGFIGGLVLFGLGFVKLRQKRLIENIPTSKIRSLAMGLVEIYGSVVPFKDVLKSPFSNEDCVYYKYTIEEYRQSGKHSRWVTVRKGENETYFYVKDETSQILVDPKGAKIDIPMDSEFKSSFGRDPPKTVIAFLKNNYIGFEGLFGMNKKMRYREYFIALKDKLYILGTASDNPFVSEASSKHSSEDIMIQKNNQFYYISDKPEKDILRSLKWKVFGGIYGGALLSVVCLTVIIIYFNIF